MRLPGPMDFVLNLIRQAEHACAEADPGMQEAAAMVYVGDVYQLLITRPGACYALPAPIESRDTVWPFIR